MVWPARTTASRSTPVLIPAVEEPQEFLHGQVARRASCERASTYAAGRCVEAGDPGLETGQDVGERLPVRS